MNADQNSTNNKWLGIGLVASVVLVAILVLPTLVSWPTISTGGWLVAGLLTSAGILIGGEYLIKKWGLNDFSAKAARAAFYFAAIVIAGIGITQTMSGGFNLPNMGPSYLHQLMQVFGFATPPWWLNLVIWFAAGSIVVMFAVGVYNHFKDGAPAVTKGTATLVITGAIIMLLMWMVLGPTRTGQAITAVQSGAQTQFDGWMAGGKIEIDWGMITLGFIGLAFLLGLWKKDIIRTAFMIVSAVIWLPFIAWKGIQALPAEFKADVQSVAAPVADTFKGWTKPTPPAPPPPPKLATDNRSDLGDFAPIFLGPDQERVLIKYQDDALCYYPVPGLGIWHRFEEPTTWFPGFDNNAWAIKLKNNSTSTIEVQAWREAGLVCNSR